jgi:hypothetical protein
MIIVASERNYVPEELSIAIAYHSLSSVGLGPFRAKLISDQAALETHKDGTGYSGTGPKTAWVISGRS